MPSETKTTVAKRPATDLEDKLIGALTFIMAFYEPGQRHLDTEAWKVAEASGRHALAQAKLEVTRGPSMAAGAGAGGNAYVR